MQTFRDLEAGYYSDQFGWYKTLHEARKHRQLIGGLNRVAVEARQNTRMLLEQLGEQHAEATRILASGNELHEQSNQTLDKIDRNTNMLAQSVVSLSVTFDWQMDQVNDWLGIQAKQLESVVELLRSPMETKAREAWTWAQRAMERGWTDDALEYYQQALATHPFLYPAHLQLGHLHAYHRGDAQSAVLAYQKACKYAMPDDPIVAAISHYNLYALHYSRGELDEAWDSIVRATELDPSMAVAWWDLATFASEMGKPDAMIKGLRQAIQRDPLFWNRGKLEDAWGDYRQSARRALAIELDRSRCHLHSALRGARSAVSSAQLILERAEGKMGYPSHPSVEVRHLHEIVKGLDLGNFAILRDAPPILQHQATIALNRIHGQLTSLMRAQEKREHSALSKYQEARERFLDESGNEIPIRSKWTYLPLAVVLGLVGGLVTLNRVVAEETWEAIVVLIVIAAVFLLFSFNLNKDETPEDSGDANQSKTNGYQLIYALLTYPARKESRAIYKEQQEHAYFTLRTTHKQETAKTESLQQSLRQIESLRQELIDLPMPTQAVVAD